ncbi:TetR/AcrR family transcriptional regulator [Streptomyces sp. CBMA152]|uniref:TetR/AcrR family transcriptional regulator n=1 Tax=Streptomyces sp. CBMA152 TaxID=1896312 RepID=UPI001660B5A7|nr:TetR/AcrR family transcriptional regulator [Streptomyces sp. CBMA152]MBD0744668.1 TetR family transcriptional regulator [Streptomyces sp. CBMA152]
MATSRPPAADEAPPVSPRRRGPVLERAILDATLEQLSTVGWNALTMEGVAARAQTGKAAVYRRWSSKEELVADALRSGLPDLDHADDHGSVREDLYRLCLRLRDAMYSRSGFALRSVLYECDAASAERFHGMVLHRMVAPAQRLFAQAIRHGIERGDVRRDADAEVIFDVIPGLMMFRTKVRGSEWPDQAVAEMVDLVLVPLLRPLTR